MRKFRFLATAAALSAGVLCAHVCAFAHYGWPTTYWQGQHPQATFFDPVACQRYMVATHQARTALQLANLRHTLPPALLTPVSEGSVNFDSDYDFLKWDSDRSKGVFFSQYLPEYQTRVHLTATARPLDLQRMPMVDAEAKGLIIYLPGAGTDNIGGEAFAHHANQLASLGYASVSLNYPMHRNASQSPYFYYESVFMPWLQNFIYALRAGRPHLKVLLMGHSFGANLVAELITRDPFIADGALALSMGAIDSVTEYWNQHYTPRAVMKREDFKLNATGARWVYLINSQFHFRQLDWRTRVMPDPTSVNPNLRFRVVWGRNDEFIPGPITADGTPIAGPRTHDVGSVLRWLFSRVETYEEPDADHRLMGHKDSQTGQSVVVREVLRMFGEDPAEEKELRRAYTSKPRLRPALAGQKYFIDPIYRAWIASETERTARLEALLRDNDEREANVLLNEYESHLKRRRSDILERIRTSESWAPEFFTAHRDDIAMMDRKGFPINRLLTAFFRFLEKK